MTWAINSFKPVKSTGLDGIIPALLHQTVKMSCNWMTSVFASCMGLRYIPEAWKRVRVTFIPNAGKSSHVTAKYFRPTSLPYFLLKTFERLINWLISGRIIRSATRLLVGSGYCSALYRVRA